MVGKLPASVEEAFDYLEADAGGVTLRQCYVLREAFLQNLESIRCLVKINAWRRCHTDREFQIIENEPGFGWTAHVTLSQERRHWQSSDESLDKLLARLVENVIDDPPARGWGYIQP